LVSLFKHAYDSVPIVKVLCLAELGYNFLVKPKYGDILHEIELNLYFKITGWNKKDYTTKRQEMIINIEKSKGLLYHMHKLKSFYHTSYKF